MALSHLDVLACEGLRVRVNQTRSNSHGILQIFVKFSEVFHIWSELIAGLLRALCFYTESIAFDGVLIAFPQRAESKLDVPNPSSTGQLRVRNQLQ